MLLTHLYKVMLSFNEEFRTKAGKDVILTVIGSESTKHMSIIASSSNLISRYKCIISVCSYIRSSSNG